MQDIVDKFYYGNFSSAIEAMKKQGITVKALLAYVEQLEEDGQISKDVFYRSTFIEIALEF